MLVGEGLVGHAVLGFAASAKFFIFAMLALVFACATISTLDAKNSLLPTWSPCVWVLMMWVIGLSLTVRTLSRIAWPQLASLVSTSTTPLAVM